MAQKYSYNGVELPELPSGLEGCPYLFIFKYKDEAYYLFAAKLPISYDKSIPAFVNANDEYLYYHFYSYRINEEPKAWSRVSDPTINPNSWPGYWYMDTYDSPVWANHDIYYAENYVNTDTVFLKGSSYEVEDSTATDIDPNSLLMGWLVGRRIAGQRKKKPDVPSGEPVLFLYGTPSESGNIGLRVGDTVTYYDGAVATAYPTWDSVPYVAIVKTDRYDCVADYSSCPIVWAYEGTLHLGGNGTNRMYNTDVFKGGVWLVREPKENTLTNWGEPAGYPSDHEKILWSNHDIKNSSGTEVMFAKSPDPIPVSGIVEYINGIPIYE